MKNMKCLILLIVVALAINLCPLLVNAASAQSKIIRKTVKKVVKPQIAPGQPPNTETTAGAESETPPPPPAPPTIETKTLSEDKGLFGWGINTNFSGALLTGSGLFWGTAGEVVFSDPLLLGEKIGLAEDAVEYKVGLGFGLGSDFKTIPLLADAVIYLKEGSFFGMDPYVSAGLNYNLYGTGGVSGGLGGQINLGILTDFGLDAGKGGISLGYGNYTVANTYSATGMSISVSQPFKL